MARERSEPDADAPDELIRGCIDGRDDAWSVFVERYGGVIWAAVRRAAARGVTGEADAGDLVQDVFVRLLRDDARLLRSYDPARSSLPTWLALVTRSLTIDHLRRRRIGTVPLGEEGPPPRETAPAGPAGPASGSPETPAVPLGLLTARQRLVLRMIFDEGMSVEEAAAVLGVDPQTVRSTKHKALIRLRGHFGVPTAGKPGMPPKKHT